MYQTSPKAPSFAFGRAVGMLTVIYYVVGDDFLRGTWVQYTILCMAMLTIFTESMMAYIEKHLKKRIA